MSRFLVRAACTLAAVLLGWGPLAVARAQETSAAEAAAEAAAAGEEPAAGEEMIVYGDLIIRKRREALTEDLMSQGYRPGKDKGDYTIYRPDNPWHPSVAVYDEGFVVMKRTPVRFDSPIAGHSNLRYLACVPPLTILCIRPGGQIVSPRKLDQAKGRVAIAIDPELDAWQEAMAARSTRIRVEQEVPALLEAVWQRGDPLQAGGERLETPEARRAAIIDFWASRAQTVEGDKVREAVELFVRYEIQTSSWPVTAAEAAAAEQRCGCGRKLLGEPASSSPDGAP